MFKKTLLCLSLASALATVSQGAFAVNDELLIVHEIANKDEKALIVYDPYTQKYLDAQNNEIVLTDWNGQQAVVVDVDHLVTSSILCMNQRMPNGQPAYGATQAFVLNFKNDVELNRNTVLYNPYSAIELNNPNTADLEINMSAGKTLTIDAKPATLGEYSAGIYIGSLQKDTTLRINKGSLVINMVEQDKYSFPFYPEIHGITNYGNNTSVLINNDSLEITQNVAESYRVRGISVGDGIVDVRTNKLSIKTAAAAQVFDTGLLSNGTLNIQSPTVDIDGTKMAAQSQNGGNIVVNASRYFDVKNTTQYALNVYGGNLSVNAGQVNIINSGRALNAEEGTIDINATILNIQQSGNDVCAFTQGGINLTSGTANIGLDNGIGNFTFFSSGVGSSIRLNVDDKGEAINTNTVNIAGLIKSANSGNVTINAGASSEMNHKTLIQSQGTIHQLQAGKATWHIPADSQLTSLTFDNGGFVDFNHANNENQGAKFYRKLDTGTLTGNGGTLTFRMDMAQDAVGTVANDRIIVSGSADGSHNAVIDFVATADKAHSANWLLHQGEGSNLTLKNLRGSNQFSANGDIIVWNLAFVPQGQEAKLDDPDFLASVAQSSTGTGAGDWYLVKGTEAAPQPPVTDPQPPVTEPQPPVTDPLPPKPQPELQPEPLSREVHENLVIGTSAAQAMSWLNEKEDLRQRLGEVRYGAQEGAWVKLEAQKDRFSVGFKQTSEGVHLGYDRLVNRDEDSVWLLGGAFRYADADQEGIALKHIEGDLEQLTGKVYGTWIHDKGSYADFVLQAGRYDQELRGLDNVGTGTAKADYTTYGFGASLEIGHQFSLNDENRPRWVNHWFVEPQLELSYFYAKGANYTTSTGLKVEQANADFLNGRAGVVIGKKMNYGNDRSLDNRYFQLGVKCGINHEFLGEQSIKYTGLSGASKTLRANTIDGTRLYYGLTADWQINEKFRAYADIEREEGDGYTQQYDVNVGVKYMF